MSEVSIKVGDKITVTSPYNAVFPTRAKELGGRWSKRQWVFPKHAEAEVRALVIECYGTDGETDAEMVLVELVLKDSASGDYHNLHIAGLPIARVFGRDDGAKLSEGVVVLKGGFTSGGSRKNYDLRWSEGTTVRLEVPTSRVAALREDRDVESLTIVSDASAAREALESERETLQARLAEIEAELKELENGQGHADETQVDKPTSRSHLGHC